jgi:hypothetical protein
VTCRSEVMDDVACEAEQATTSRLASAGRGYVSSGSQQARLGRVTLTYKAYPLNMLAAPQKQVVWGLFRLGLVLARLIRVGYPRRI